MMNRARKLELGGPASPRRARLARPFLRAGLAAPLLTAAAARAETVTVAMLRDGADQGAERVGRIGEELARHRPQGTEAVLRDDPAYVAGWDPERAAQAWYDLGDPTKPYPSE